MTSATGSHARLGHRGRRRTPVRTYLTGALGILLLFALLPSGSFADGSRTAFPNDATCQTGGSCRVAIEWSTSSYGPATSKILRRTLFSVFLKSGESLDMGSSAIGVGSGDAWVWQPGDITDDQTPNLPGINGAAGDATFKCSTQRAATGAPASTGMITTRAQEQAGPQTTGNSAGYVPCTYVAPATGVYKVAFFGPSGNNAASTGTATGDITLASANNFSTAQGTTTAAWDLTVRGSGASTTPITGRVFTYVMAATSGSNNRPLNFPIYATTLDGYVYRADLNGVDPNAFLIYGNEAGFLDPQGNPLYHDVVGEENAVSTLHGGTAFAPPQYPISLTPLSSDTLGAISVTTTPQVPVLTNYAFNGATSGKHVYENKGGTFSFTTNEHGTYQIVISRDGSDFDPTTPTNRVLRGVVGAGDRTVVWDGKDNLGNPFPTGTFQSKASMHAGVYHFPLIDAENSVKGGPSFTLINPPNGTCAYGNQCSTAFYDDRGYHTSAGDVGTVGTVLCGSNPPATAASNAITGFNSTTAQRAFGNTANAGNGESCINPKTNNPFGQFGDQKGLDTWTSYPSSDQSASFAIDPTPAAPTAGDDTGSTLANTELVVGPNATNGLLKNDTGTNITVTGHGTPAHGSVTTTAAGGWDYTPDNDFSGTDTFPYTITDDAGQTATATVTVTVAPTAGDDRAGTTAGRTAGAPVNVNVLGNDHGSALTVSTSGTSTNGGTVTVNPDRSISYTPAGGYSGKDTFSYTVTDSTNQTATATVTVDVVPLVTDDSTSTRADAPVTLNVLTNDVAASGSTVSYGSPAHGTLTDNGNGSVTYAPSGTFSGTDSFTYQVTDPDGEKATGTVTVTVTPVAVQDVTSTTVNQPVSLDPTTNDKGSNTSVGTVADGTHGTVTKNGNTVTYTPAAGYVGTDSFTYTLNADGGSDPTGVVTVTVKPRSPDDAYSVDTNATLAPDAAHGVLANDTPATGLTISSHTDPTHGTLTLDNSTGAFTYVPQSEFSGTDTFTYTATGNGASGDPATVTITVRPTFVSQNYGATAGRPVTVDAANGVLHGAHGTGLQATPATITTAQGGTVVLNRDGSFTYTPKPGYSGPDSFSYTVGDTSGYTTTQTSAIVVAPDAQDDSATGRNGSTTTVPVRANDTGTNLTVSATTNGAHGTVSTDGSTVSYTPTGDFSGTDTFTYTVKDASNQTATATVTMTVRPHAVDDRGYTMTAASGASIGVPVLDNDRGTNLSVASVSQPTNGGAVVNQDGTVTYTPTARYSGTDTFTYTLAGDGGTDVATVVVTVKPQAIGDTGTVAANGTLTVPAKGVLANDLGSNLTASTLTQPTHGQLTLSSDGSYVYTPDRGYSGPDSFVYTASDGANQSNATVNLTVTAVAPADGPYPTDAGATLTVSAADGVLANDSGNPTITSHTDPGHGTLTLNNTDGSFTYTPTDPNYSGTDTFTYSAKDASGQTTGPTTVTIVVRPVGVTDTYQGVGGTQLVVTQAQGVLVNDHATNPRATAGTIQTAQQGTVTMAADGSFTYQPPAKGSGTGFSGTDSFTYTATDGSNQGYTQTATIDVAPHAVPDTAGVAAGTTTATVVPVLTNDNGSNLSVTVPQGTTANGGAVTTDGTTVSYTPARGFSGKDTFGYTITDSATGETDSATVTVTVSPLAANDAVTTPIGTPTTVDELANDTVYQPTVTIDQPPANGQASVDPSTQKISYAPRAGFSGKDTIIYTATDPSGLHASATITITVTPAAGTISNVSTDANTPVSVDVVGQSQGSNLTVTGTTNGSNGTVTTNPDGKGVTYTPKAGFSGDDTFTYTVSDGTSTSTGTVKVAVLPTGADDTGTTPVNTTLTVAAPGPLAKDAGTNLTATLVTQAQHGTVTMAADGSYRFVPASEFSGADSFTYKATDDAGRSVTQTVRLTVTPTVADDSGTTKSGTALTTTRANGVLANDHGSLTASVPSAATTQGGTVTMAADGSYTYTPKAGFSGRGANADTFTYSATDGTTTRTATVTLTVTPVATDDAGSTPHNTTRTVAAPGLLGNDLGTLLTVVSSTPASHGTVTRSANDGRYSYTPDVNYSGSDSFTYTVQDSSGQQATATVRLSVGLSAAPDSYTTPVDTALSKDAASGLLANDNGTSLRLTGTTQPTHGTVSALADGSFTFTPDAGWSGNDSFTYTAQDASGGTATGTVTLKVTPRAVDDTGTTSVGVALQGSVLGNDRGTGLRVLSSTTPQHGTVTVAAGGSYTYTPQAGYSGPDSFDYTATDQAGSTTTATVRITVKPTATDDTATTPADTPAILRPVGDDLGTSLTLTSVTQPAHGTTSVVDGAVRFVPEADWSGVTTCSYTVTDASGQTATAQLTIRVTPVAVPERVRTGVDTPVTLDSVLNDRGSSLRITAVTQPPATQGQVAIRDGRLVFRPASGFVGTVTFDYTVTDAAGQTTTATDTVVVSPVSEADPDTATTTENHSVTVDPTANDPGHGSFVLSTLQLRDPRTGVLTSTVHIPGQGTYHVVGTTGKVTFTPVKGFHGKADPVTYQVADTAGTLHVSTIRITVEQGASATSTTSTTPTQGADHGGLPGTGGPFGPALPVGGLALLLGGLVLLVRRRRADGGDRVVERVVERGSHRAR